MDGTDSEPGIEDAHERQEEEAQEAEPSRTQTEARAETRETRNGAQAETRNAGKKEMASLDARFLVKELRSLLTGGVFRKIYQYGKSKSRQFLMEIFVSGKGSFWLYIDSNKVFLTRFKKAVPEEPPMFCMFLRKHLMGKRIKEIKQHEFDRIIEIHTDDHILIAEMFGTGNLILCDTALMIIMPLEVQRWKTREIRPKVVYKYPPRATNPFRMDFDEFRKELSYSERNMVAYLATNLGFGPEYAGEVCARAGVDGKMVTREVDSADALKVFKAIESIGSEKPEPTVYDGFVSPFRMVMSKGEGKPAENLSSAFDEFFSKQEIEVKKEEVTKDVKEEVGKAERIVKQQEEGMEKWKKMESESKETADIIYANYSTVQAALDGIRRAREMGLEWKEIKERISSEDTPEAGAIKEIREGDGIIVMELDGKRIEIDIRKSVEGNAAAYYEDSKWARKKHGGIDEVKEGFEKRLEDAKGKEEKVLGEDFRKMMFPREKTETNEQAKGEDAGEPAETGEDAKEAVRKPKRKKWFEKFKWFFSTDGFLVVAGRDASSNDMLIKKHSQDDDVVFHADIHGAAFVVIKSQGMEVPDETRKEAAEFAAANSKAWSRGLGTIDIYSVRRSMVSNTAPSGQNLPKGSFMINGEREWFRNLELKLAIGIRIDPESREVSVVSGPLMPTRKNSDYFVTIKPGYKKSLELAAAIKNKILIKARPEHKYLIEKLPLDEIQVTIPSGMGDVVEHAGQAV